MVMGIGGRTLPPNVAQVKANRDKRSSMMSTVPGTLHGLDEFRDEFYESLSAGNMTGRRLGALLWRMPSFMLLEFNADSDPSAETISQLLQKPKTLFPAGDSQPQAEKAGLGFYHCLTSASPLLQGKLFLYTFSKGMYGIPSHQRGPMIPEAVKIANMGTRLLKEQADLLLFALYEAKSDSPLWNHFYCYLRRIVLPLSMAKRRKRAGGSPLTEGSFMESVARTFGALWVRYLLAPDFDASYAALWGRVWATILSAVEDGADHAIFRTPAKDDIISIVHNILLAMVSVRPDLIPYLLGSFGFELPANSAEYGGSQTTSTVRRKMATGVSSQLRAGVAQTLPSDGSDDPDVGDGHRFMARLFDNLADKILILEGPARQKVKDAFSKELLSNLVE